MKYLSIRIINRKVKPNTVHLVLMSYQFYLIAKFRFGNAYFAAKLGLGCEVI